MKNLKNILITGAGGFVGKRLTFKLASQGFRVFALMKKRPTVNEKKFFRSTNVNMIFHDLENLNTKSLPPEIDCLITLAQSANYRYFPEKAEEVFKINATVNLSLFQWALNSGVNQVIHVSSGGIYGGKKGKILSETDLISTDPRLGFYLSSKLCSEIIFQNYMDLFQTSVILRPFFIYGQNQNSDMFIARLINSIKNEMPVQLHGKNGLKVNPIFVDDASTCIANSMKLKGKHVINLAGPDALSLREVCNTIGNLINTKPIFEKNNGQKIDFVSDTEQAKIKLNHPMTPFKLGIEKSIFGTP